MVQSNGYPPLSPFEKHLDLARIYRAERVHPAAIEHFIKALEVCPDHAATCFELGDTYFEILKIEDAIHYYKLAHNLESENFSFLKKLSETLAFFSIIYKKTEASEAEAIFFLQKILEIDPHYNLANQFIGEYHQKRGRHEAAKPFFRNIQKPQMIEEFVAKDEKRKVLIIQSSGAGNLVFNTILAKETNTRLLFTIEHTTESQLHDLPSFDIAFNVLGNPDFLDAEIIHRFEDFARITGHNMLNEINSVTKTRRDLAPTLFQGIKNMLIPQVVRMTANEIHALQSNRAFATHDIRFPVIIRPAGGHGGRDVHLIQSPESFCEFQIQDSEAFYIIQFFDYKSDDGFYRKYRTLFVGRKLHHYHLAVSKNWMVHYFSADMLAEQFKRDEEKAFLEQPEKVLGKAVISALEEVAARMDLDYCGIDYSIMPDGRLIVFEANPLISVYPVDPEKFGYKVKHVNAIFAAVEEMLQRKAGA